MTRINTNKLIFYMWIWYTSNIEFNKSIDRNVYPQILKFQTHTLYI